jgi:hypothetical protein
MSEPIVIPAEARIPPPRNKWEREYRAFKRLLPELMKTHHGKYVAIHEERVVDAGEEPVSLALRVMARIGDVAIHVGYVSKEPERICRSGVLRDLRADREES